MGSVTEAVDKVADGPDDGASVSVVIPCRNEIDNLPAVLAGIEAQSLPPLEVLAVDGRSTDGSREWLELAAAARPWLRVLDNPEKTIPNALNHGLAAARGEYVARMDAHARYVPDYLGGVVGAFARDPAIVGVGGWMETGGTGTWGEAIAAVMRRPVGMGGAPHRVHGRGGPVDHVFSGCYRREALLAVGGYDPDLRANEDFEMDVRLRGAGGVVWLDPNVGSTWYAPSSLPALITAMARYGHFKAHTLRRHPRSLRPRQLAPPLLVLGLVTSVALGPRWFTATAASYVIGTGVAGARAAAADGASRWRAALVPAAVHLSWGSGLLSGIAAVAARGFSGREAARTR